jgi:hypothetical protein
VDLAAIEVGVVQAALPALPGRFGRNYLVDKDAFKIHIFTVARFGILGQYL